MERWKRRESSELESLERWEGSKVARWERWEDSEVPRSEKWEGSEVADGKGRRVMKWQGGRFLGFIQGWETLGKSNISSFCFLC